MKVCKALLIAAVVHVPWAVGADDRPIGALMGGDESLLEIATAEGDADWRLRDAPATRPSEPPSLEPLLMSWDEADFPRCEDIAGRGALGIDTLLLAGFRDEASIVAVIQAGCAYKLGDVQRAEALTRSLLIRQLDSRVALEAAAAPDFLSFVDDLRGETNRLPRVTLSIDSTPRNAQIRIDGLRVCDRTPCSTTLSPGSHMLEVRAIGFEPHVRTLSLDRDQTLIARLEAAGPELASAHLARALAHHEGPVGRMILSLAAQAFGARVVLFVDRNGGEGALYDRAIDRTVRTQTPDPEVLVRRLIQEWQGELSPPLRTRAWFWGLLVGAIVVAGSGIALGLGLRPDEERFVIRFGMRE